MFQSALPPPPSYYKLFADGTCDSNVTSSADKPAKRKRIPPPPPKPPEGTYVMFGESYSTDEALPSLQDQGREQLYPQGDDIDKRAELKKLNRSLLVNMLQLLDVLITSPSQFRTKIQDIELLFVNMHHLVNSFRPHQAREMLIASMRDQIERKRALVEEFRKSTEDVRSMMCKVRAEMNDVMDANPPSQS
eukprot:tig00021234_g19389.t1